MINIQPVYCHLLTTINTQETFLQELLNIYILKSSVSRELRSAVDKVFSYIGSLTFHPFDWLHLLPLLRFHILL